jgi:hypothetical protein
MIIGDNLAGILALTIRGSVKLLLIFLLFLILLPACSNEFEDAVKREIFRSAINDNVIDKDDFENIKNLAKQYEEKTPLLKTLSNSDSQMCKFINDYLKSEGKKYIKGNVKFECPVEGVPPKLDKIRFYIETSMSMAGYMNGGTEFQATVNNMIGILGGKYGQGSIIPNTIVDEIKPYSDLDSFRYDVTNSRFAFGGHSPVDRIFSMILSRSGLNDISIFITDAIMSGSNSDVQSNPEFNIEQTSLLMNNIRARFDNVKGKFSISVYGFRSRFNSNSQKGFCYFTYRNGKVFQNFKRRPFYVFVIGNKQLLKEVTDVMKNDSFFRPEKSLDFGIQNDPVRRYTLFHSHLPIHQRGSCLFVNSNSVKCKWNPSATDPVKFGVGLNLSGLPGYARENKYLTDHLGISISNNIRLTELNPPVSAISGIKLDPVVEQKKSNSLGCTHFLNLTISDLFDQDEIINVTVRGEEDNWYESWSCTNDLEIGTDTGLQEKTFNLNWLIYGIRSAYSSGNLVDIKIPVSK